MRLSVVWIRQADRWRSKIPVCWFRRRFKRFGQPADRFRSGIGGGDRRHLTICDPGIRFGSHGSNRVIGFRSFEWRGSNLNPVLQNTVLRRFGGGELGVGGGGGLIISRGGWWGGLWVSRGWRGGCLRISRWGWGCRLWVSGGSWCTSLSYTTGRGRSNEKKLFLKPD